MTVEKTRMKAVFSSVNQFLPCRSRQKRLEVRNTFGPTVTKYLPKDGVVCYSQLPSLISVHYMDNFNCISEQRDRMRLDQIQHNHVWATIDSKNGVGTPVEFPYSVGDWTIKCFCTLECDAEVWPFCCPFYLFAIKQDVVRDGRSFTKIEIAWFFSILANVPLNTVRLADLQQHSQSFNWGRYDAHIVGIEETGSKVTKVVATFVQLP